MTMNRQVLLKSRPVGIPEAGHFEIVERPLPEIADGELLIRNHFLSVDPAMRGWVNDAPNYLPPVAIGEVMRSFAVGRVHASRHPKYREGDLVTGLLGWQEWAVLPAAQIDRKLDDAVFAGLPSSAALGVLGLNGVTAYHALLEIGRPRPGDTVVVSSAAGSVGACVGQIAKIAGCRTIGIAGGARKVELCRQTFGFDDAVDYRDADFPAALKAACGAGVDLYFDNTSGPISDAVYALLRLRARVVVCGTVAYDNWAPPPQGPRIDRRVLVARARVEGFIATDWMHRWDEAVRQLSAWMREGRLTHLEEVLDGIEAAPASIAGLYRGENFGKRVIRLASDT
ncbi:MAG: NADP-dependent oxidoreductase [Burkholderiales bacterium]|nr:NADP-dependent oxidoreductase [Burkholderiales bacterium]